MPAYDYTCAACGRRFEVIHGVHAEGPTVCPLCGSGPVRKAITAPAVHYRGSGWAKKERRSSVPSGAAKSEGPDAGDESGTKAAKGTTASGSDSGSGEGGSTAPTSTKPATTTKGGD